MQSLKSVEPVQAMISRQKNKILIPVKIFNPVAQFIVTAIFAISHEVKPLNGESTSLMEVCIKNSQIGHLTIIPMILRLGGGTIGRLPYPFSQARGHGDVKLHLKMKPIRPISMSTIQPVLQSTSRMEMRLSQKGNPMPSDGVTMLAAMFGSIYIKVEHIIQT